MIPVGMSKLLLVLASTVLVSCPSRSMTMLFSLPQFYVFRNRASSLIELGRGGSDYYWYWYHLHCGGNSRGHLLTKWTFTAHTHTHTHTNTHTYTHLSDSLVEY
jgi:hypothetical protein